MENAEGRRGLFFAFEGIDGSGKTTQLGRLSRRLRAAGVACLETREPTDAPVGALIRRILTGELHYDKRAIAALFAADRLDHLVREGDGLLAALERGVSVLSDRYYFSSYAYNGADMPMEWVIQINRPSAQLLRPTATIFVDVDPDTALARIDRDRGVRELYETRERLVRVRELYLRAFEALKGEERVLMVDGNTDPDTLEGEIWERVQPFFRQQGVCV